MKARTGKSPAGTEASAEVERRPALPVAGQRTRKRRTKRSYVRADSLHEALGSDERRDTVCEWLFGQAINRTKCMRQIAEDFGVQTTVKAVAFFYQQYAFAWKVGRAKSQADIEKDLLPPDWEARIRKALAQRRFEATLKELEAREILAFERLDLDKRKVDLKESEVFLAERRLVLLERKMEEAQEALADHTLPAEEQARRIRRILGGE